MKACISSAGLLYLPLRRDFKRPAFALRFRDAAQRLHLGPRFATQHLWFAKDMEAAIGFYTSLVRGSSFGQAEIERGARDATPQGEKEVGRALHGAGAEVDRAARRPYGSVKA